MATGREVYLDRIRDIVVDALAGYPVTVYLFGSRARGDERWTSDVDVAVEPHGPLPARVLADLREALEKSTVPWRVEVVDLNGTTPEIRDRVRKEGIVWSA
jgi:hypothetical protein